MKKDITPYNEKIQPHGYWETYYSDGKLMFKGNYYNGEKVGYDELYYSYLGILTSKKYNL